MHDVMYSPSRFPFHGTTVSISVGISAYPRQTVAPALPHMVNVMLVPSPLFAIYEEVSRTLQVRRNNPGLERKVA
jgi:hypothetical protein